MSNKIKTLGNSKPLRMWIDGKCYNIKQYKKNQNNLTNIVDNADTVASNQYDFQEKENGLLCTKFHLPLPYLKKIKNYPGFNVEELSENTQTCIQTKDQIEIFGDNKENISNALAEIHSVIGQIRNEYRALQFIAIPLLSEEIQQNFMKFKNEVLQDNTIEGMEESIFQSAKKLHLTVNVFSLLDNEEQLEAKNALNDYYNSVLKPLLSEIGPLKIRVAGIDCMNTNHEKVDVLYANVKLTDDVQSNSLQKIVNNISDYFYERGLIKKYQDGVKLHMTLINTKYRKEEAVSKKKRWGKRKSFDAKNIMEKYKEFVFGDCNFDSIHLSLISSIDSTGFYKSLSRILL